MSNKTAQLLIDPTFKAALAGPESIRKISQRFGVSFGMVQRAREAAAKNPEPEQTREIHETTEVLSNGTRTVEGYAAVRDRPVTMADWREWISVDGDDPEDFIPSIRTISYAKDLFSNKLSATPKRREATTEKVDWSGASRFVEDFTYIPAKKEFLVDSAILQPTDEQWGKTDFNGGTVETEERVLNSYAAFADYVREYRPRQILMARTGDGIENFCNTPSQRDTNDLDLPHMLVQSFKMDLAGLKMIAPLAQEVINAYVPSNHGRWRTGLKDEAGNEHADFGIGVGKQLAITIEQTGFVENVRTVFPEPHMASMSVKLDTITTGLVHGHQVNNPDRLGDWWQGQDHGRMPTWDADLLLVGHFHSFRVCQSGDGRWIFVGPSSDNGSSWFSNLKGERATAGMLALSIEGKRWRFQEIL